MATRTELEAAYLATTYRVFLPGGVCDLRLGQASDTLRCWLETAGAAGFAILTAHNPGGRQVNVATNAERQSQMEVALLEGNYETYVGENLPDDGVWPVEESCFVPDISLADALALGAQYGQNAIVHGEADGISRLAWITENEQQNG